MNLAIDDELGVEGFVLSETRVPFVFRFQGAFEESPDRAFMDTGSIGVVAADVIDLDFADHMTATATISGSSPVTFRKEADWSVEEVLTDGIWYLASIDGKDDEIKIEADGYFSVELTPANLIPAGLPYANGTLYQLDRVLSGSGDLLYIWLDEDTGLVHAKAGFRSQPWLLGDWPQFRLLVTPTAILGFGEESIKGQDGAPFLPGEPTSHPGTAQNWLVMKKMPYGWTCWPDEGFPDRDDPTCFYEDQPRTYRH